MKNLRTITGIFFLLISSMISAQESLNDYLKIAAENNPGVKAKFNEYMAALEVAPQVKVLPDPQVAFGYFISPLETRMGPQRLKISASQMFPWKGTLKARENVAVKLAKAKYELFEETKSKLYNNVKAAYFDLYFNRKAVSVTLNNIEILTVFQKLANVKVETGLVSMLDQYRIEMEINEMENQLALLKDKEYLMEVMFRNLLNTDDNGKILTPENLWTTDFSLSKQAAIDSVKQLNHQLLSIDFQQEALGFKRNVAELNGKPNIKVGFEYMLIGKGDNNLGGKDAFVFPTVGITIPLYRNKYKAMVNEVVFLEKAKNFEKVEKSNILETLFESSWKDYNDACRRLALYEKQYDLAKRSISLIETDYATGNKNFEEILRMERKVLKFNLELEKAKTDKQAAIAFIEYLMGK